VFTFPSFEPYKSVQFLCFLSLKINFNIILLSSPVSYTVSSFQVFRLKLWLRFSSLPCVLYVNPSRRPQFHHNHIISIVRYVDGVKYILTPLNVFRLSADC
jgi:hypothetical protein